MGAREVTMDWYCESCDKPVEAANLLKTGDVTTEWFRPAAAVAEFGEHCHERERNINGADVPVLCGPVRAVDGPCQECGGSGEAHCRACTRRA